MTRRRSLLVTGVAVLALLVSACGSPPASTQPPAAAGPARTTAPAQTGGGQAPGVQASGDQGAARPARFDSVRVMYGTDLYSLALHVAIEKGFFAEEGLTVNPTVLPFGNLGLQALVGGNTDFAVTAGIRFVNAVQQKFKVKAVSLTSRGYGGQVVVPVKDTATRDIAELKGKKIGLQQGTGITAVFNNFLMGKGLSPKDFQIVDIRNVDIPAALERGDLDAALVWEPQASITVNKKLARVLLSYDDIAGPAKATFSYPILTSEKLILEKPDLVQRFINAWARAMYWIEEHRDEAAEIQRAAFINQGLELPSDVLKAAFNSARYGQVVIEQMDVDDWNAMADAYLRAGLIKEKPGDLWAAIDNQFAKKAAEKFGKTK